uniref:Uncharacterized protein n=1 Tax=Lepeophtheirus salmonis TaxID=72036 RepID=A0A0K2UES1_LEPSM
MVHSSWRNKVYLLMRITSKKNDNIMKYLTLLPILLTESKKVAFRYDTLCSVYLIDSQFRAKNILSFYSLVF